MKNRVMDMVSKEDFEVSMLRLHDRLDSTERKIDKLLDEKNQIERLLDNQDVMKLTMMSDSTLYRRRKEGKLKFLNRGGKNYYTPEEVLRFMHEELQPR